MKKIKILAPATIANMVCGFDVLGMAVAAPQDEMYMELNHTGTITINHIDEFNLSTQPQQNVAGVALEALLAQLNQPNIGFAITINKQIKPGSGLGSSAASAAGAVVGANYLLGQPFTNIQLVAFAMAGEAFASGAAHPDNVAPCIYGGITLVRSASPLDIISLQYPPLYVAIAHPQIEIKTADARKILKTEIALKTATQQWANVGALVAGLLQSNYSLIGRALHDVVAEPLRSKLIPSFDIIKQQCLSLGAIGGGISGSGPSIFMLCDTELTATKIANNMQQYYSTIAIACNTYTTSINSKGVTITEVQNKVKMYELL